MTMTDPALRTPVAPRFKQASTGQAWAIVLAGGEGNRLRALTTTADGVAVPKQFCSLRTGPSLLHGALRRAEAIAARDRICAVVARQHAHWWCEPLEELRPANVFIQPRNRGTAVGMLLALAHIAQRDPDATVVILPSDHHLDAEAVMGSALQRSAELINRRHSAILLLGIEPEEPDPELGYIVPGEATGEDTAAVAQFIEKPTVAEARALIANGALWNAFILVARVEALLALFVPRHQLLLRRMQAAVRRATVGPQGSAPLDALYASLPNIDFSREIVSQQTAPLAVLPVPRCGWTDLGTVERVEKTLLRSRSVPTRSSFAWPGLLSLEQQHNDARKAVRFGARR